MNRREELENAYEHLTDAKGSIEDLLRSIQNRESPDLVQDMVEIRDQLTNAIGRVYYQMVRTPKGE